MTAIGDLWVNKSDAAMLVGKSEDFIRLQIIPRIPPAGKRRGSGRGTPWELHAPSIVRAFGEYLGETLAGDPAAFDTHNGANWLRYR
jgi:hypothetical protein